MDWACRATSRGWGVRREKRLGHLVLVRMGVDKWVHGCSHGGRVQMEVSDTEANNHDNSQLEFMWKEVEIAFREIESGILYEIDKMCRNFIWHKQDGKNGLHYVSRDVLCKLDNLGGHGLHFCVSKAGLLRAKLACNLINKIYSLLYIIWEAKYGFIVGILVVLDGAKTLAPIVRWKIANGNSINVFKDVSVLDKCLNCRRLKEDNSCPRGYLAVEDLDHVVTESSFLDYDTVMISKFDIKETRLKIQLGLDQGEHIKPGWVCYRRYGSVILEGYNPNWLVRQFGLVQATPLDRLAMVPDFHNTCSLIFSVIRHTTTDLLSSPILELDTLHTPPDVVPVDVEPKFSLGIIGVDSHLSIEYTFDDIEASGLRDATLETWEYLRRVGFKRTVHELHIFGTVDLEINGPDPTFSLLHPTCMQSRGSSFDPKRSGPSISERGSSDGSQRRLMWLNDTASRSIILLIINGGAMIAPPPNDWPTVRSFQSDRATCPSDSGGAATCLI
ncbi:hypothetical protein IEQ34_006457 [Dendrobium chrysotoxum]|uniref:Uncharacterized protein n=1 Tax=Dendrobium chrysotoxum TaxID=161865 RepID=A0AAV7HEZ7_DENCH|nr:hypothetical protein IEQ34_006457 [Dendrobium chrysotoxum]